jgi:hypothetical protein
MQFALVIPALNEEAAIAGTLRRALAARATVVERTSVTRMTVVFVNDGCTDNTQQIVDQPEFCEVLKVRFAENQGYGAAIKAGWKACPADLLGFTDADGTCDPVDCVVLIRRLEATGADVVLANRINLGSRMPLVRRIGNRLFAGILGVLSGAPVGDCASGFRVLRRSSLRHIWPLPDGLHFTPTMSAICLLDPELHIEEVTLPYEERIGRSKLSVLWDGLRFLYTIVFAACCYAPMKTMLAAATATGLAALVLASTLLCLAAPPAAIVAVGLAGGVLALQLLGTGAVCHQLNHLLIGWRRQLTRPERWLHYALRPNHLIKTGGVTAVLGIAGMAADWVRSAAPTILGLAWCGAALALGGWLALGGVIIRVIWAVGQKQRAVLNEPWLMADSPPHAADAASLPATAEERQAELSAKAE